MRAHGAAAVDKDLLGHGHDRYGRWCIESSVNVRIIEQFNGGSGAAVPPAARPTAPAARTPRGGARARTGTRALWARARAWAPRARALTWAGY